MDCEKISKTVLDSLTHFVQVEPFDLGCRIVLPQLDIMNDFLVAYVTETDKGIELTDFGRTLELLNAESVELDTEKRTTILTSILDQNRVRLRGDELVVELEDAEMPQFREALLLFTNAMQSIHAMLHLKQPRMTLDFRGLVRQYLFEREVPHDYLQRIELPTIGFDSVDFVLQTYPKVAIEALHSVQTYHAKNLISRAFVKFRYLGKVPGHPRRGIVFNDESIIPETRDFPILEEVVDIAPIPWSDREERFSEIVGSRG